MHVLLFEVLPKPGHERHYFERAAALRPIVERNPGLLFLERFKSLSRPGLILSYQLWQDEDALAAWRRDSDHKGAQQAGRAVHFADYRIRIATVLPEAREPHGGFSGAGQSAAHVVIVSSSKEPYRQAGEAFSSVTRADAYLAVIEATDEADGRRALDQAVAQGIVEEARLAAVSRDYGMHRREQAPSDLSSEPPAGA